MCETIKTLKTRLRVNQTFRLRYAAIIPGLYMESMFVVETHQLFQNRMGWGKRSFFGGVSQAMFNPELPSVRQKSVTSSGDIGMNLSRRQTQEEEIEPAHESEVARHSKI